MATLLAVVPTAVAQGDPAESLAEALAALRGGDAAGAAGTATTVLQREGPPDPTALWIRGNARERLEEYAGAAADFDRLAHLEPSEPGILVALGGARFKAGDMEGSIEAFDAAAQLDESLAAQLWQRGISHYYSRRLDDCVRQFEIHRTVNPQDVENSVWHFLCVAARDGFERARSALIPVGRDGRVPMREVFRLFSGEGSAADVLRAAEKAGGTGSPLFYAHLYLGLYHEAFGNTALSARHVGRAVDVRMPGNYMWQVARVHRELRAAGD